MSKEWRVWGEISEEIARCCFLLLEYRVRRCLEFEGVGMSSSSLALLSTSRFDIWEWEGNLGIYISFISFTAFEGKKA